MPKANRASIFASFDALKGFKELLKEQEVIIVPKKELSEDDYEILNRKIHQIKVGDIIGLTYYDGHNYIYKEGLVAKFNYDTKMLQLIKTKIDFKSIIDINLDVNDSM